MCLGEDLGEHLVAINEDVCAVDQENQENEDGDKKERFPIVLPQLLESRLVRFDELLDLSQFSGQRLPFRRFRVNQFQF